jgi:hypothetical protein
MCTKTSLPPLSGWINPYPLVALNHFTVPIATSVSPANEKVGFKHARFVGQTGGGLVAKSRRYDDSATDTCPKR